MDDDLEWEEDLAGLDYGTRETIVGLTVTARGPLLERVWVWAYFVNPNLSPKESWSDAPAEVPGTFDPGRPTAITASTPCSRCTNPDIPPSGYSARVRVSAVSAEDARTPPRYRSSEPDGAIPVVVADAGMMSAGIVRHPELDSHATALGKTAIEKTTGRELGRVEDVGYRDRSTGEREEVYSVLYRGGIRLVPVADTRISETDSGVSSRVEPAENSVAGLRSAEDLEASPFIRSRAFERVEVRRIAEGEICYLYRSSTRPGLLPEISISDGSIASAALLFDRERLLDTSDYAMLSELFTTPRPGAPVGDDVLDYIRVTVGDDLTRVPNAPPCAFCDIFLAANTPLGSPIVSLTRRRGSSACGSSKLPFA